MQTLETKVLETNYSYVYVEQKMHEYHPRSSMSYEMNFIASTRMYQGHFYYTYDSKLMFCYVHIMILV